MRSFRGEGRTPTTGGGREMSHRDPFRNEAKRAEVTGAVLGHAAFSVGSALFRGARWVFHQLDKQPEQPKPTKGVFIDILFDHSHVVAGTGFGKTQLLQMS